MLSAAGADEAGDQYAVAAGHYARTRWGLAVEEFEAFLERYPEHAQTGPALFFLGEALVQQGKFEKAGVHFQSLLANHPDSGYIRLAKFRASEAIYLQGDLKLARQRLTAFSDEYPTDALHEYVLPYLAEIEAAAGNANSAEKLFRKALRRYPLGQLQDDCRFGLARALEELEQTDEAERLLLAVAAKPRSPLADHAQFRLGCLEYSLGSYDQALKTFSELEQRFPQSVHQARSKLGRGRTLFQLKRWAEAERIFAELQSAGELPTETAYWRGVTQKAQGEFLTAASTLLAAFEEQDEHELFPSMRFHAGDALRLAHQYAEAQAQFDLILQRWPASDWVDDALIASARVALAQGKHAVVQKLANQIEQEFADSPAHRDAVRILCQSLLSQQRAAEAVPLMRKLLASKAADAQRDRTMLAVALVAEGEFDSALEQILPILESADPAYRSEVSLVYATALVGLERHQDAIAPLQTFLSQSRGDDREATALAELSICYLMTDHREQAKATFDKFQRHSASAPLIPRVTLRLAEEAQTRKYFDWAAALYERLIESKTATSEQQARGWSGLAWVRFRQERIDEANDCFFELLARFPEHEKAPEAALATGQLLERQQRFDGALAQYDLASQRYPDSSSATASRLAAARLNVRLKQLEQAITLYQQFANDHPAHAEMPAVLYEWSWACRDSQQPEEAQRLLARLNKNFPDSPYWADATYRLANGAFDRAEFVIAERWLDELLNVEIGNEILQYALFLKGRVLLERQQWNALDEVMQRLVDQVPDSHLRLAAEYYQIEASFRQENFAETEQRCRRLIPSLRDVQQDWVSVVSLRLAQSLASQDKWDEAQAIAADLKRQDVVFAESYEADYLLGRCLARRADFDGARKQYRLVLQAPLASKTETAAMSQWMIGETFFHQKQYAAALREYLRVEILYAYPTWQSAALLQAAKCYEHLGEWSEAVGLYQRLVTEYPNSTFTAEAVKRLPLAKQHL